LLNLKKKKKSRIIKIIKNDVIIERLDKIIEDNVKINSNNKYFIPIRTVKKIIGEEFLGISDESNLMEKNNNKKINEILSGMLSEKVSEVRMMEFFDTGGETKLSTFLSEPMQPGKYITLKKYSAKMLNDFENKINFGKIRDPLLYRLLREFGFYGLEIYIIKKDKEELVINKMEPDEKIKKLMNEGKIKIRVKIAGMYELRTFSVVYRNVGSEQYITLYLEKPLNIEEMQRVANEMNLPVESGEHRVFPAGKGAVDFIVKNIVKKDNKNENNNQ